MTAFSERIRNLAHGGEADGTTDDVPTNGTSAIGNQECQYEEEASPVGRVASPLRQESTSSRFFFWVPRGILVEKTHLVRTSSRIGVHNIVYYGLVEEVYRRSRKRSIDEEVDTYDGELSFEPPFVVEGVTFAEAAILGIQPPFLTPPLEGEYVFPANAEEAQQAYGFQDMRDSETGDDWGLPIGLLRNGAEGTIGVARIDARDLNGERAGHLNVTGQAGRGTKSSFLLLVVQSLISFARARDNGDPRREPLYVRPIVFNVKGNDLMYIDAPNRYLNEKARAQWLELGIEPKPFVDAEFLAPCQARGNHGNRSIPRVIRPGSPKHQTQPYYWTLSDVVGFGLWPYLFSEETQSSETMMALADHILGQIAEECRPDGDHHSGLRLRQATDDGSARSFDELRERLRAALRDPGHPFRDHGVHTFATCRALLSRLSLILGDEGAQVFDVQGTGHGRPLRVIASGTTDPLVIDIATLPPELRRFVVATVVDQVKQNQLGPRRIPGQVYFIVLDELGIYAPRGARDPITKLFEHVAAQLRSQGIILLGAQQQASKVSDTIFGMSEVKVLGASSPVELESPTWGHLLSPAQKARAAMLQPAEKLVLTPRGWMNVVVPFPAWAMKESERVKAAVSSNGAATSDASDFDLNLPGE